MSCVECSVSVEEGDRLKGVADKYNVPFRCGTCKSIKFMYQAVLDRVFVFPDELPEKIGSIVVPQIVREFYRNEYGIVLSVGKGHYDKKKKRFVPIEVKVGDRVMYDKKIPWKINCIGSDDKEHEVKFMGEQDVFGVVNEETNSEGSINTQKVC